MSAGEHLLTPGARPCLQAPPPAGSQVRRVATVGGRWQELSDTPPTDLVTHGISFRKLAAGKLVPVSIVIAGLSMGLQK